MLRAETIESLVGPDGRSTVGACLSENAKNLDVVLDASLVEPTVKEVQVFVVPIHPRVVEVEQVGIVEKHAAVRIESGTTGAAICAPAHVFCAHRARNAKVSGHALGPLVIQIAAPIRRERGEDHVRKPVPACVRGAARVKTV